MPRSPIARNWCFTLNNPKQLLDWELCPAVRYAVYQEEIGESGTHHFQGYVEFSSPQRLTGLKKLSGLRRAHWEPRKGTREEARDYCMKPDSQVCGPYEYGEFSAGGQGRRNDITAFKQAIDTGSSDLQLWDSHPAQLLRYFNTVSKIRLLKCPRRNWPMEVHYYCGVPGTGKSKAAMDQHPQAFWVSKGRTGVWWDGYAGESTVVLDELDGTWFTWTFFLKLLDRYPMNVETKGSSVPFLANTIVITSNRYPWELYSKERFPLPALFRRITQITLFGTTHRPQIQPLEALFLHVNSLALETWLNLPANYAEPGL